MCHVEKSEFPLDITIFFKFDEICKLFMINGSYEICKLFMINGSYEICKLFMINGSYEICKLFMINGSYISLKNNTLMYLSGGTPNTIDFHLSQIEN